MQALTFVSWKLETKRSIERYYLNYPTQWLIAWPSKFASTSIKKIWETIKLIISPAFILAILLEIALRFGDHHKRSEKTNQSL